MDKEFNDDQLSFSHSRLHGLPCHLARHNGSDVEAMEVWDAMLAYAAGVPLPPPPLEGGV